MQYRFYRLLGRNMIFFCIMRGEDEMCGTCSTNGGEEKCVHIVGGKYREEEATRKTKT
jgi:hypothetical protein